MNQIKVKKTARVFALTTVLCLALTLLVSCAPEEGKTPAEMNREYMASVSQITENLNTELDAFVDAAAEGDVPAMKIASDRAEKQMQKIQDLKAPKDMKQAHKEYTAGLTDLDSALDGYIDLYSQINAGSIKDVDAKASLADIQKTYDSGIKHLSAGDELTVKLSDAGNKDKKSEEKMTAGEEESDKADDAKDAAEDKAEEADEKAAA